MKIETFLGTLLFLSFVFAGLSHSQEASVSIDAEGKLEFIDAKLGHQLGLFTEYKNFREARLFQVSDTSFVLEILYQPEEKLLKTRLSLSAGEAQEFQQKVTERIKQEKPQVILNQEGRTKLLAGTLALSLGYYGWAVPVMFNVGDGKTVTALYMLTSGAGFFIPLYGTRNMEVTDAEATFSLYGGTRGIVHGIFLYLLFAGESAEGRATIASGMMGSVTEAISFFSVANRSNMTPGTAEVICIGGDFGLGLGIGTIHLVDFVKEDKERLLCASILFGSGAGLLAGKFLADHQPYTRGDAYVLRGAGILGAYLPLGVVDMSEPEDNKAYTAAVMAGSVAGLGLGHYLVRGKDFTTGQGTLINLGEFAGGLVGIGIAYLASSKNDNSALYLTSSAVGATAGFWLVYRSFARSARSYEKSSSWNIRFSPENFLAYALSKRFNPSSERTIPIAQLEYRF